MAALVQTSQTAILQHRPASATGLLESQSNQAYSQRSSSGHQFGLAPRNISFTGGSGSGSGGNMVGGGYRGIAAAPVAPYAFTSTPPIQQTTGNGTSQNRQQNKQDSRSNPGPERNRHPGPPSTSSTVSTASSNASNTPPSFAQIQQEQLRQRQQQQSNTMQRPNTVITSFSGNANLALPSVNGTPSPTTTKPSPDRYRRGQQRRTDTFPNNNTSNTLQPGGNEVAAGGLYSQPVKANSSPSLPLQATNTHNFQNARTSAQFVGPGTGVGIRPITLGHDHRVLSTDDIQAYQRPPDRSALQQQELANRRRSLGAFDMSVSQNGVQPGLTEPRARSTSPQHANITPRKSENSPNTMHPPRPDYSRRESNESSKSQRSNTSSTGSVGKRQSQHQLHPQVASPNLQTGASNPTLSTKGSYNDVHKRSTNPSPLSKPMTLSPGPVPQGTLKQMPSRDESIQAPPSRGDNAADRLAALQIDPKKGLKSRLRRAFSFGSAAELRQASNMSHEERIRLRQEREEAEQAKIAEQQEAGGLGNAIYSNNQGNIFSGSTDNLSIQSTASSASVMLRKMGKGMKKSSRSLVGLFRPKSVIGVAPAAGPIDGNSSVEPSMAQVSMVNVEAEREKVNVNADLHQQAGGGTGFPKLEQNSLDTVRRLSDGGEKLRIDGDDTSKSRKSMVGGDAERAEVLAAVKRGILKHKGSASPVVRPTDGQLPVEFQLPQIPTISSNPTSPDEAAQKAISPLRKNQSNDYFLTPKASARYHSPGGSITGAISAPVTPSEIHAAKVNVSFSPRITFHDTWPSGEYDRRGEPSTCNRLTPLLAQQIKEELNSFKMEMEIHEDSKVYTHFF